MELILNLIVHVVLKKLKDIKLYDNHDLALARALRRASSSGKSKKVSCVFRPMSNERPLATVVLVSYVGLRLIWEIYIFPVTMSSIYAILNFSVLLPFLAILSYAIYAVPRSRVLTWVLFGMSGFYLASYTALGILLYPLLFTVRVDNPKSLFIDVYSICIVLSSFLYTFYLIRTGRVAG